MARLFHLAGASGRLASAVNRVPHPHPRAGTPSGWGRHVPIVAAMLPVRRPRSLGTVLVATLVLAGVLPLLAAVGVVAADGRQRSADADRDGAARMAGSTARELSPAFDEWAGELLVAAQNDALKAYYRDPERRDAYKTQIDASLVGLHSIHPDLIDEACYIDAHGPERARMVRGAAVTDGTLSPDESGNPFFTDS